MVVYKLKKNNNNEDPNFWSNGRVQMKKINQWRPSFLVEWSCTNKKFKLMRTLIFGQMVCTKERINERGPYNLVEWPCTNKRNKSLKTLTLVEWLCTKERINERGPYMLVEWSCEIKDINQWGPYIPVEWSCILLPLKSRSAKEASHHTAFMGNCSTV